MADNMKRMVRKQLNIAPEQEAALKRMAEERGVSESELVREAIDGLIAAAQEEAEREERVRKLHELFAEWDRHPLKPTWKPGAYRFGCYDDEP